MKLPLDFYLGLQAQRLETDVRRAVGVFSLENGLSPAVPGSTTEELFYRENSFAVSINQLVATYFVLGASYRFTEAQLSDTLPQVPVSALPTARQRSHSGLHQASQYILFNHPSGFFARGDATWYHQHNSGFNPAERGDDFVQENLYAGYRFWHRRAEIRLGLLNLSGQNYHLSPLTVYAELPRKRAFEARLNFVF